MPKPSLKLVHPEASREALLEAVREIPGASVGIKIAALLLALEGQRPGWVAEVLGLIRQSLNLWMHKVNEQGLQSLNPVKRPGRPARLTPQVRRQLEEHLEKSLEEFGLNRARWDGPTLVVHLKKHFGIHLKVRQAQSWMHQLGYRMKRAGYTYLQSRSEDAKKFRRKVKKAPVSES
jgi:transposase